MGQCVDTRSGSVDTRELPRTPSGLFWDSVLTLDQVVSTLVALPEKKDESDRVQERKATKFTNLKQHGLSVAKYKAKFSKLALYAPHLV
ncbi:hypothetical protein Taro_007042 [Colocasia esculenta]|uniref:Retrotransposon gag domain-containing protein n=1 Tax=Colocasia esculenta TaxID=4460 RepID=A0A843TSY0_COLES|nr:hypothetical protein [Colocasia esculenta]